MLEEENIRFMEVVERLKKEGDLTDYVELAILLDTNKAGISDIKQGRKKVSIDALRRMKKSYSRININYIITGEGASFCDDAPHISANLPVTSSEETILYKIYEIEKEENKALIKENGRLEERIRSMTEELATLKASHAQSQDKEPDHHPEISEGLEAFTSEPSGGSIKDSLPTKHPTISKRLSGGKM